MADGKEQRIQRAKALGARLHSLLGTDALREQDFTGADLRRHAFAGAELQGVRLTEAKARRVDFHKATLTGAHLERAMLAETDLHEADLRYARLMDAVLVGANLEGACLDYARLEGANLYGSSGRPSSATGARLTGETYRRSKWTPAQLYAWEQAGAVVVDFDALPEDARDWMLMRREGLLLYFATPLAPMDHMMLHGVIAAWRRQHPHSDCRLVDVQERGGMTLVRILSSDPEELVAIAEALCALVHEEGEEPGLIRAVRELTNRERIRELRWLVRRGERWELWVAEEAGLSCARTWTLGSSPGEVLEDLLRSLFDADALRRFIRRWPGGEDLADELPGEIASLKQLVHKAVRLLEGRGLIAEAFFLRLVEVAPGRRDDIRFAAVRWGVELPVALALEGTG